MHRPATPEQPNLEQLIQATIQRLSIPDRPLQTLITTAAGPRNLRATIQTHYQDRAKLKTLASVLDSLRIPEVLFWILLSKTYKLARLNKEELNRFSGHLAQQINTTTEM